MSHKPDWLNCSRQTCTSTCRHGCEHPRPNWTNAQEWQATHLARHVCPWSGLPLTLQRRDGWGLPDGYLCDVCDCFGYSPKEMSKQGDWTTPPPVPDPPRCRAYIGCPSTYRAECRAAQRCTGMKHPGRFRRWLIARRLRLRCLVCNRRAGYGGTCPNPDHNG